MEKFIPTVTVDLRRYQELERIELEFIIRDKIHELLKESLQVTRYDCPSDEVYAYNKKVMTFLREGYLK